ncbi:type VI secretion system baseplate subunit TssG [Geomonas azotofigens]|uniref:type VI secretion system baseplate subunit TssG n=1 Tax=Geomonas azotofigens TaxID=2843196 RepID=UPI001C0FFD90|nr:type VI secretion system baseplate subunit TssG [Geomonas azotofigens]MBU5613041.1 type VI secretion system baseplate subunit TssG [Geomonas azotofigens]
MNGNLPERCGAGFFATVRLLERVHRGHHDVEAPSSPETEKIRFTVKKGFAFPVGDVTGITFGEDGSARVETAVMGLTGPSGVLPHWYHELLLERERANDHAMGDFYDLFHHRLISIFYRSWKRTSFLPQKKSGNSDVFSIHLLSFLGLGTEGVREKLSGSEPALLHFCGQASRPTASAGTIARIVQSVFGVDAEVEPFVPRSVDLESSDLTTLGENNCLLGVDAVCGGQTSDIQSTFRLRLGPMAFHDFIDLSSEGRRKHLASLVRFLVGPEYEFEVRLVLRREDVPGCRLGTEASDAPRLGHSTWLKAPCAVLEEDPFVTIDPNVVSKLTTS